MLFQSAVANSLIYTAVWQRGKLKRNAAWQLYKLDTIEVKSLSMVMGRNKCETLASFKGLLPTSRQLRFLTNDSICPARFPQKKKVIFPFHDTIWSSNDICYHFMLMTLTLNTILYQSKMLLKWLWPGFSNSSKTEVRIVEQAEIHSIISQAIPFFCTSIKSSVVFF